MKRAMKRLVRAIERMVVVAMVLFGTSRACGDDGDPLYPIYENGLWGLIDATGKAVLKPGFEQIGRGGDWIPETWDAVNPPGQVLVDMTLTKGTPVTDRVIPVRLAGRFALATRDGGILVHGIYEKVGSGFSEGLLPVVVDGRTGFVNDKGDLVIPARWEQARWFRNGHAFVRAGGRWGVIDRTGKVVVEPRWDEVGYSRDWVQVREGKDWGVVDTAGKVIVPVRYDEIRASPMPPLLPVMDDGRILYLRPDGAGTIAFEFLCPKKKHRKKARALGFFRNHAALVNCGGKYGVIDESGALVLEPEWEDIANFRNGRAEVRHKGKKGVIDETGRFIVALQSDINFWSLDEEEFGFSRSNGEHGFFDRDGRVLRTFAVESRWFSSFEDGLAIARRGSKDGYIDRWGKWVIEPRFHRAMPFRGPLAVVEQPVSADLVEVGYINRDGDAVYRTRLAGFEWMDVTVDPRGIAR